MEGSRPIQSEELKFFTKGTGEGMQTTGTKCTADWKRPTVPLVAIFTKFDAQIIKEYVKLNDIEDDGDKWYKAKENAEKTFQNIYLPKVVNTEYPPKIYVHLEGENDNIASFKAELTIMHYRHGFARDRLS